MPLRWVNITNIMYTTSSPTQEAFIALLHIVHRIMRGRISILVLSIRQNQKRLIAAAIEVQL